MSVVFYPNVSRAQKTYVVAMTLLGAVAAVQILAALYLYTRHQREAPAFPTQAAVEARLFKQAQLTPTPSVAPAKLPAVTGVPPATVRRAPPPPPTSVADTLLRVAKGFRERGDTTNAIAKLQQASALDPGNAEVLAELAMTYESMQLFDRSNEVWRRLQSLGRTVGPLYELADVKLRLGVPAQGSALAPNGMPAEAGAATGDAGGIPDGSTFGISEVTLKTENDPEAQAKLLDRKSVV